MSVANSYKNHSSQWYTPARWLDWAATTLGGQFFDPCPFDWVADDPSGLEVPWLGPTYVNHPGSRGSVKAWWSKAVTEISSGRCTDLIWCLFNMEQLRHMRPSAIELPGWLVLPDRRLSYIRGAGDPNAKVSPTNWSGFWSSRKPAATPDPALILPTGGAYRCYSH